MINQQLGNYKFLSVLGEGGMAKVYLAENIMLNSKVAIKVLKEEFVNNKTVRTRFLDEAKKEYNNVRKRLIQEIVQNSYDAGATEIHLNFSPDSISFIDNGHGMDKDRMVAAMLTLAPAYPNLLVQTQQFWLKGDDCSYLQAPPPCKHCCCSNRYDNFGNCQRQDQQQEQVPLSHRGANYRWYCCCYRYCCWADL